MFDPTASIAELRREADEIEPVICLGDEDSIFLTPQQVGFQNGLRHAANFIEEQAALAARRSVTQWRDIHRFAVVSSDYSRPFMAGAYETIEAATRAQCGSPERWPIYVRYSPPELENKPSPPPNQVEERGLKFPFVPVAKA